MATKVIGVQREQLLKRLTENIDDMNPFVREADATYLRFDTIELKQVAESQFIVIYRWRGMEVLSMSTQFILDSGNSLVLSGIHEGRLKVSLTP